MEDTEKYPRQGLIMVVCAPSGTGKSTLISRLREEISNFGFSISYTTRAPRGQERDGREYHFVSRDKFIAMRSRGEFAEWAEVHGNFYGTAIKPIHDMLGEGKDILFDIDVQGALQLRKAFPNGVFVYLLPPSKVELERRLRGRGTDSEETIVKRMDNALGELKQAHEFDYWIVNDDLGVAFEQLKAVYYAGCTKPGLRPEMVADMINTWRDDV